MFLCNWKKCGGTKFLGLEASACMPGSEDKTTILDYQHHMEAHSDNVAFQAYGKDLSVIDTDVLLSKTQGVHLKVIKENCDSGLFK